jgi:hypothetical protein
MTCRKHQVNLDNPIAPSLAGTENFDISTGEEPDIPIQDLPHCSECAGKTSSARTGLLRLGTVGFVSSILLLILKSNPFLSTG